MNQLQILQKKAIDYAKNGDWEMARNVNQEIVDERPTDIAALNRLGFCLIQLNKKDDATKTYKRVLEIEKLNPIARKYVDLLKQNIKVKRAQTNVFEDFVEEPRKTKMVHLDRLADPKILSKLSIASACTLKPKGRFVCVQTEDGEYVGSLPEDISLHLSQLIKTGNQYMCIIRSVSKSECVVFIKEKFVAEDNKHTPSFFVQSRSAQTDEVDEDIMLPDLMDQEASVEGEKDLETEEETPEDTMGESLPPDLLDKVEVE